MIRECKICYEKKSITEFRVYRHKVNGKVYESYDSYCKDCRRLYDKEQRRIQRARLKDLSVV